MLMFFMVGPLTQLRLSWVVRVKNLGQAHRVKNRVGVSPGVKNWFGLTKKWDQFWVQANNLGNHPKLNPLLGLSQALRVQIRVQTGSDSKPGRVGPYEWARRYKNWVGLTKKCVQFRVQAKI